MNTDRQSATTDKIILFVEDNPNDVDLTKRAFEKNRIANELVFVEYGQEALDYLLGSDDSPGCADSDRIPAVILSDLKLLKVDGFEVQRRIKSNEKAWRIPLVILTTSKEEPDMAEGYDLGANRFVREPVGFAQFTKTVRQLGLYWLVLNEQPPKVRIT